MSVGIGIIELFILAVIGMFIGVKVLGALTQRHQPHYDTEVYVQNRRRPASLILWVIGVFGVLLVLGVASVGLYSFRSVTHRNIERQDARIVAEHQSGHSIRIEPESPTVSEVGAPGAGALRMAANEPAGSSEKPPEWTTHSERIIEPGAVPRMLFVVSSEICPTEAEARAEAEALALARLQERLDARYSAPSSWPIPIEAFRNESQRKSFTHETQHKFGTFTEPMYQVFLQFEDSPQVRQPIDEQRDRAAVAGNVSRYGAGMLILALLLGTFSATMRGVAAPTGHKRGPILTAVALGVAGAGAVASLLS